MLDFPNPSGGTWKREERAEKPRKAPEPVTVRGLEPKEGDAVEVITVRRIILKTLARTDAEILLRNGWEIVEEGKTK